METIKYYQEIAVLVIQWAIIIGFCMFLFWSSVWSIDECNQRKAHRKEKQRLKKQLDDIQNQVRQNK